MLGVELFDETVHGFGSGWVDTGSCQKGSPIFAALNVWGSGFRGHAIPTQKGLDSFDEIRKVYS